MPDQNTATILAAIVGGILTIMGGFLATYFAQKLAKRSQNQKIFVDKAEELYVLINRLVDFAHINIGDEKIYEDVRPYLFSETPSRILVLPHFACYVMQPSKRVDVRAGTLLGHTWSA